MCSAAKHVPEIAKGFYGTQEFKELPSRISEIKKCLKNVRQSLKDNKKAVEKSGDDCLQQIHTLRQQFNAIFDRLEQRTVSEIEDKKSSVGGQIQTDIDRIDDVTERLQKLFDDFNDEGEKNEATSYIGFTKCDDMIWNAKVLLQEFDIKDENKMLFEPYTQIAENLSSFKMLGEVICDGREKLPLRPDRVFEVEEHVLHNVKLKGDTRSCNITGLCKLASGEFLLIDNYNLKIKRLNSNYKVTFSCDVPEHPQDVCVVGDREAAVTVNKKSENRHEIHLFRLRSEGLVKTRSIDLQYQCCSLAHHSGNLYITTHTSLHVYNISSGQYRQLYSDETGKYTVYRCAVSPDGSRIFITNATNHQLITLNKDGTKLSTLTHPEIQGPWDVHVTSLGHMFVSCGGLNTVVQVVGMKDGRQTVKPLAGEKENLAEPMALCFNSSTNTLVVGLRNNDNIAELQLKH